MRRRNGVKQVGLAGILADIGTSDGNGDDFCAGSVNGGACLGKILVLARADEQAGTIGLTSEGQLMHGRLP